VVTVLISEESFVVCETRGGASAGALNFFGLFSCSSRRFDAKRGGDRDREREEVGWRKRKSCRFFSFPFTVVSLQLHAFRQVGSIHEDRSFSRCINIVCLFFLLFFCCEGDAVMFGVDFKRCLSPGSGAKPLQVLYFFLFGVVVCGLSEVRVEENFSRCVDIFCVFFPPVGCEWKCGRVWCSLQAFFIAGSGVKLWRTNILA
jgi:hypothetical protein